MRAPRFVAAPLSLPRLGPLVACALVIVLVMGRTPAEAPGGAEPLPLLGRIIVVDPGHGGIDPGCHRGPWIEKEIVLRVGEHLAGALERMGATAPLTRTHDVELSHLTDTERTRHRRDLAARVLLSKEFGAELFISLHVNAAGSDDMGGAMVFHRPGSDEGRRLAESVLAHLRQVVPGNQNSALPADFYILRRISVPAILVETGFITHPDDRAILTSSDGPERIAAAIALGLADYVTGRRPAESEPLTRGSPTSFLRDRGTGAPGDEAGDGVFAGAVHQCGGGSL